MSARSRPKVPFPLARAFAVLVALALALLAFGVDAPAARANSTPHLEITSTSVYDGQPHSAAVSIVGDNTEDYYLQYLDASLSPLSSAPTRTDAGTSGDYTVVLLNHADEVVQWETFNIHIDPRPVTVTITGNRPSYAYDGQEHTAVGYTFSSSDPLYKESYMRFTGTAEATRSEAGTTIMEMGPSQFVNDNANFNVEVEV